MDKLWFLAEVDIFRDLAPADLEQIAARAPMQSVAAGSVFFSPERAGEVLFILKRGRARLFRLSPGGKGFTTAILGKSTIFGEMAILGQQLQDQYAEALDDCVICLMSKADVQELLLSDPRIAARIAETLGQRLLEMERRLSGTVFKTVPQRVADTLLSLERAEPRATWPFRQPHREVCLTHEQLAEFVGTYRETVTKALSELRELGLIELRRGRVVLLDAEALAALAGA
jgi:CRP/FNR family cyclic AMP-dependent transcriptional regulator